MVRSWLGVFMAALLLPAASCGSESDMLDSKRSPEDEYLVFVGTYTDGESRGVYGYRFRSNTGDVKPLGLLAELKNPSFLALHPDQRFLYAVSEVDDYDQSGSGSISSFAIDPATGGLTRLNEVSSQGGWPCHIKTDSLGRWLAVANYRDGSIALCPIRPDGSLGEASSRIQHSGSGADPERQEGPHAHAVEFAPQDHFLIAADLGLDKLLVYRVNPQEGRLEANQPPFAVVRPGAGPRHLAFHPSGGFVYTINEMDSTVTVFSYDNRHGVLEPLQVISTLPEGFTAENSTAEIDIDSAGQFLYASNRGHDSISVFSVSGADGKLQRLEGVNSGGSTPRSFALDPSGRFLLAANQTSNNIVVFRIDPETGRLRNTGVQVAIGAPVCIKFATVGFR